MNIRIVLLTCTAALLLCGCTPAPRVERIAVAAPNVEMPRFPTPPAELMVPPRKLDFLPPLPPEPPAAVSRSTTPLSPPNRQSN